MIAPFINLLTSANSKEVIRANSEDVILANPEDVILTNPKEVVKEVPSNIIGIAILSTLDEETFATIYMGSKKLCLHYSAKDFLFYGILEVYTTHFIYLAIKKIENVQSLTSGNIYCIG